MTGLDWLHRIPAMVRSPSPQQAIGVLFVFLGLILLLSVFRVRSTRISLNAASEAIAIVADGPAPTSQILLGDLTWTGDSTSARLPDGSEVETDYVELVGSPLTVRPIELRAGGMLVIQSVGRFGRYDLLVGDGAGGLELLLPPGASVAAGGDEVRTFDGEFNRSLRIGGLGPFHLDVVTLGRERLVEAAPVRSLAFWREDSSRPGGGPLSTVREGLLILEDVAGQRIELRDGEPLRLGALEGVLRSMILEDGLVRVQFDGRASDIRSGYGTDARSLMPSLLDRIVNIPQVKALLAVVAILLGSSLPRWNRRRSS